MKQENKEIIKQAYEAFNARDIDKVLSYMHKDVHWPNGWEGGYVDGHEQVRDYWKRQWKELNPVVKPVALKEKNDGRIEVDVHQLVKDLQGNVLADSMVKHIYTFKGEKIKSMEIEKS